MGICSKIKVGMRPTPKRGRRNLAQQVALAERIGNRTKIDKLLKSADKLESDMIELNRKIAHTKDGSLKRKELVNLIIKKNAQKSSLVIEASKLHKANQKK